MSKWKLIARDGKYYIDNEGYELIPYDPSSGIQIIELDGYAYLDLNGNGRVDTYEDWHLDPKKRYEELILNLI